MRLLINERGSILAPVMGVMTIVLALALNYMIENRENNIVLRYDQRSTEAFYIMEAGIEDAISELLKNPGWRTGFQNKSFHNGQYSVSIVEDSPKI